ncbi:hypothetical protein DVS77_21560 [Mycolicibacterium moriokaense]|nr:hypothetical protein DVS77_21560 [Mycolicibacterium moriokaense]
MNIVTALANYLTDQDVATLGQDLFISRAPTSNDLNEAGEEIPQNIWWLLASGGTQTRGFETYNVDVWYRDIDAEAVYNKLQALHDSVHNATVPLTGFEVIRVEALAPVVDQDIDNEERTVGLLQLTITTYKEYIYG